MPGESGSGRCDDRLSGFDEVVCGARGFYRVELVVSGKSGHTGMPGDNEQNALRKGAALIDELYGTKLSAPEDRDFPFGPKLTVTKMRGGNGFSVVPDECRILVDIRLTNTFRAEQAAQLIRDAAARAGCTFFFAPFHRYS